MYDVKFVVKDAMARTFFRVLRRYLGDRRFWTGLAREIGPWLAKVSRERQFFDEFQKVGATLVGNHFYQPIPYVAEIPEKVWTAVSELRAIEIDEQAQLTLLSAFKNKYYNEYDFPTKPDSTSAAPVFYLGNGAFESVDAEILHCFVRHFRPKRVVEIGGGYSSLVTAGALVRNREDGYDAEFAVIEPYPAPWLGPQVPGISKLFPSRVQDLSFEIFESLEADDILFVDSSHVVQIAGDVNHVFFEILPRLQEGVLIHIHDILLPQEYLKRYASEMRWFWQEQYLLRAFLMHNMAYRVLWAGNYMRLQQEAVVQDAFPSYRPGQTTPGSFWMRKNVGPR